MILKFLYIRYKKEFHDLMVEDLLREIPSKIGQPAIEILAVRREQVIKWLYFEANSVFRRDPTDFVNLERRNGVLILIKALILGISKSTFKEEKVEEVKNIKPDTDSWLKGVDAFTKKEIKSE